MPACNADNPACKAPIAESLVLSFLCCAISEPVWPATFALTRLVTSDDTSSDALPVEPLMTDCAADALAGAGTLEALDALDALEIVDIKMLRTSGLLLSLDENRPLKASLRRALGERYAMRCDAAAARCPGCASSIRAVMVAHFHQA